MGQVGTQQYQGQFISQPRILCSSRSWGRHTHPSPTWVWSPRGGGKVPYIRERGSTAPPQGHVPSMQETSTLGQGCLDKGRSGQVKVFSAPAVTTPPPMLGGWALRPLSILGSTGREQYWSLGGLGPSPGSWGTEPEPAKAAWHLGIWHMGSLAPGGGSNGGGGAHRRRDTQSPSRLSHLPHTAQADRRPHRHVPLPGPCWASQGGAQLPASPATTPLAHIHLPHPLWTHAPASQK